MRDPLDDYLGPSSSRYFGEGFRRIQHSVSDIAIDAAEGVVTGRATIRYCSDWSSKGARSRAAHLSSVDAIVIAATMAEHSLRALNGLSDNQIASAWVRSIDVRAGSTPLETLEHFPVALTSMLLEQVGTEQVTRFRAVLGPLRVSLDLQHARGVTAEELHTPLTVDLRQRIYGELHKTAYLPVAELCVDADRCSAVIDTGALPPQHSTGLESQYSSSVHVIGMVVLVAQLAQVLLYAMDGLVRENSETLWMRRISISLTSPRRCPPAPLAVTVRVRKTQIIDMRAGGLWRVSEFALDDACGISGNTSVAHQISSADLALEGAIA